MTSIRLLLIIVGVYKLHVFNLSYICSWHLVTRRTMARLWTYLPTRQVQ